VRRVKGGWIGTGEPWSYDEDRYRALDEARRREQQAMLDYQATDGCRMVFLRGQLDDPDLVVGERCGRCDNCTGTRYETAVDEATLAATRERLSRPGVELAPRKQWPSGLGSLGLELSGRISDGALTGRAIGRLTDLGWGARLRRLLSEPDSEVPDEVVAAAVAVLKAWDWQQRPVAVVGMDSASHPLLISSLAARLADVGRLSNLGTLRYAPERRPVTAANSAYRVAALHGSWERPQIDCDGPVLLVDDLADSGWTLTMAARVLRDAGAPAVLPFVLASTS
jgi:ATP-dependent DNA helicase RecQ